MNLFTIKSPVITSVLTEQVEKKKINLFWGGLIYFVYHHLNKK